MRSTEAVPHTLRLRIREELGCEQPKSRIWPQRAEMHMKEKISGSPDSCILPYNRKVLNVFRQEIWSTLLNSHLLIFRLPAPCSKLVCNLTPPHPTSPPWGRQRSRFPGSESSRFPPNTPNSQLLSGGISSVNRRLEGGIQLCVVKRRKGPGEVRKKQVSLVRTTLKRTWGNRGSRSYKMHRTRFRSKEI